MDLDNFKAYNDLYGHSSGDKVIKASAQIITRVFKNSGHDDDFVGHVGGDDFLCITVPERSEILCEKIVNEFDEKIKEFYREKDVKRGFIQSVDRLGHKQKFPIMSISIAIVTNEKREITHHAKVAQIAAELKKYVKQFKGSNYAKDRRSDDDQKFFSDEIQDLSELQQQVQLLRDEEEEESSAGQDEDWG